MFRRIIVAFCIIIHAYPVHAQDVRVAFGKSVPPYIIQESNSGIEMEIIRESLAYRGHKVIPVYVPFSQINTAFVDNQVDAVATVNDKIGMDGYFSDIVITYKNYAITLANRQIKIDSILDLGNKRVSAFQLATRYLGTEYAETVLANPRYRERQDQKRHVQLLYDGKLDAIIIDSAIFQYYSRQLSKIVNINQPVAYHKIFSWNDYHMIFRDPKLRNDFNAGLRLLRQSNRYSTIYKHYLGKDYKLKDNQ